ncbi:MAG: COX15/CtaA family protein [Actinobacteria bacterium]|nr:COX15/CtaA family protein [Actinomycetota bacterium]
MKTTTKSKFGRRISLANLIAQSGIIVTGAIVRLTGSGLGCPTWPDCAPGSLIPVAGQVEGFHKYIEFGNRTLTFLVLAISIALLVFSLLNEKRNIIVWSFLPLIGTLLQAVLGGITVLTGLNPGTVMAHFLLSIVLVGISVKIYDYFNNERTSNVLPKIVDSYVKVVTLVGLAVIILGTITTGSGPHSGDEVAARFNLDIRVIAWLHADSVLLFVGLIVGLLVISRINKESKQIYRITRTLSIICLVQGFIGYVQWFNGLPWILVSFHVIGAVITWIAITNLALFSSNTLLKRFK